MSVRTETSDEVIDAPEVEAAESTYLNMSDEDMMNTGIPDSVASIHDEEEEFAPTPPEVEEFSNEPNDDAPENETDTSEADELKQETALDYRAEYERLIKPFKANGREIAVDNVDDAISLMQMGANYNKKMAALKPNLKLLKMLDNNGLLSEAKIGYLIDLEKKTPGAINKLVKDSGIDPMDIDAEKADEYVPNTYTVNDQEMELDAVLDSIQDTPSYAQTINIIGNKWDAASKQTIVSSPQLVRVINDHVQNGIYDVIAKEMEKEHVYGRLNGLSNLDAYRKVGDAIQARGGFDHLIQPQASGNQGQSNSPRSAVVTPKPKMGADETIKDKRRAASSPKTAVVAKADSAFNPLSMSDEEFSKVTLSKFL